MYFEGTKYKPGNIIKHKTSKSTYLILDIRPRKNKQHQYRVRDLSTPEYSTFSLNSPMIDTNPSWGLSLKSILKKL